MMMMQLFGFSFQIIHLKKTVFRMVLLSETDSPDVMSAGFFFLLSQINFMEQRELLLHLKIFQLIGVLLLMV